MAGKFTGGIVKIEVGEVAGDGGPGTTLAVLGLTEEDSVVLDETDGETTNKYAEESSLPAWSSTKAGDQTLKWRIMNPDLDTMVSVFGGTLTGTAPNRVYNKPIQALSKELTVKVTFVEGLKTYTIVRAKFVAKTTGSVGRKNLLGLDILCTVLTPTKANQSAVLIGE